jgi:PleD family two-component response regulator
MVMTKPLALVLYENLLPGSQLVNRLHDLGYRVLTLADSATLVEQAQQTKPLVVIVDLVARAKDVCAAILALKQNTATAHVPVLAFASRKNAKLQAAAQSAGATLVASDTAILHQLPQMLDQVLMVE